ncbi:diguanylate cyclase [Peteryoungia ipomoeae]|uniref:Diguanylate cyclase n=1 Tax=Peteryoungia ipomoeae TaxID=1210932 RepID=A0A4S8NXQ5_9HYPH|nr:diguanylate cyclase [Peteryoungia ipomoeae]THV22248.1 diguanylate cyclase [Peteryoungia ipomoeae]
MHALWNHVLANCAVILFVILAWTNLPQGKTVSDRREQLKLGAFFGLAALLVMTRPIEAAPGIQIDLRTIPIAIAGFAGGWPGALVASAMAGAYRLWIGGQGAIPGFSTILGFAVLGAVCGMLRLRDRFPFGAIFGFSVLVTVFDLLIISIMPEHDTIDALRHQMAIWAGTIFITTYFASLSVQAELRRRDIGRTLKTYEAVIQSLPESLNVKDEDGRFVLANQATAKLMRVSSAGDLIGKTDFDFYPPDIASAFQADEQQILAAGTARLVEQKITWDDGTAIDLSTLKAPLHDPDGQFLGLITHNRDLTEKRRLQRALLESEKRIKAALSNMADGLIMFDANLNVVFCNEQYRSMFPLTADVRVPGMPARQILETAMARGELTGIPPEQATAFIDSAMSRLKLSGTVEFPIYDGRWVESRTTPLDDGGCLVVCSDVTRAKQDEQELRELNQRLSEMAMTDSLTELLNRRAFDATLATELERAQAADLRLSLVLIDVDRFKAYNDTYGHTSGDQCLRQVAEVLRAVARRPGARSARYGGEELAVVLPNTTEEEAIRIAHDLRQRIRDLSIPHMGSEKGVVTASIGVTTLCGSADRLLTSAQFIGRADQALYNAKAAGRDIVRCWQESNQHFDRPLQARG